MRALLPIGMLTVMILSLAGWGIAQSESGPADLALVGITSEPYSLGFRGRTNIVVGTEIGGFVVVAFRPKFEKRVLPSGEHSDVDVSELVLKRGDRLITIRKNQRVEYVEYIVRLVDPSDGGHYTIRMGEEITIASRKLRLREVNAEQKTCTLEDTESGKRFTVKRMAKPEGGDVRE
jgi:hypothetical protein